MSYKPLDDLNKEDIVQMIKVGELDTSLTYPAHSCSVLVNGTADTWLLSPKKLGDFKKAGYKESDTVKIQKWAEGQRKGYNFVSPDKSNAYKQPEVPMPDPNAFPKTQPPFTPDYSGEGKIQLVPTKPGSVSTKEAPSFDEVEKYMERHDLTQSPPKEPNPDTRELSIVTQSILHIPGYYEPNNDSEDGGFRDNARQAKKDAIWFLNFIK